MSSLRIQVPPTARIDERVAVMIEGASPGAEVTVTSRMKDARDRLWSSQAVLAADGRGGVDLGRDAPHSGDWRATRSMAFIEAMRIDGEPIRPFITSIEQPLTCEIEATSGEARAVASIVRHVQGAEVRSETQAVPGGDGRWFWPDRSPKGAVLVLGGSGGGHQSELAALLAGHGFAALSLAYFGAPGLPAHIIGIDVSVVSRALAAMRGRRELDGKTITVLGRSRGSELAFLAGAHHGGMDALIGLVPGGVVWGGLTAQGPSHEPAWILDGAPLGFPGQGKPFPVPVPVPGVPFASTPLFEALLADAESVERCTIPLERFAGRILLVSGGADAMWPSRRLSEMIVARRASAGLPTEHLCYPDAGHLIAPPTLPTTATQTMHPLVGSTMAFGGTPEAYATANEESWRGILAFLDEVAAIH
ncbi:MAG: acyl-CoA thioesterase/BAAT N-terminal domain-containing protein [Polyangiaceae bacterium]|nr:acyl-CoA thioesterase/BAAT N-terminal domain-containing protein [Polyangiaceae bacterium]